MKYYIVSDIIKSYGLPLRAKFSSKEFIDFFDEYKNILHNHWEAQDQILREKWSEIEFRKLFGMLSHFGFEKSQVQMRHQEFSFASETVEELRKSFFGQPVQDIFSKTIIPAIQTASPNAPFPNRLQYLSSLPIGSEQSSKSLNFQLRVDPNMSQEQLRLYRLFWLEDIIRRAIKDWNWPDQNEMLSFLFQAIDTHMKDEVKLGLDTEYGSFHQVIYEMATWNKETYVAPIRVGRIHSLRPIAKRQRQRQVSVMKRESQDCFSPLALINKAQQKRQINLPKWTRSWSKRIPTLPR